MIWSCAAHPTNTGADPHQIHFIVFMPGRLSASRSWRRAGGRAAKLHLAVWTRHEPTAWSRTKLAEMACLRAACPGSRSKQHVHHFARAEEG